MDSIGKGLDPLEALEHIDPAGLNYQEWLTVGMGLKEAGCPASFWEDWSRRDPARYHAGECLRKWETFHGASGGTPVAAGTVFKMALDRGWRPTQESAPGHMLDWEDTINTRDGGGAIVDRAWLEGKEVQEPTDWHPAKDLITYLTVLFDPSEYVGYVTETFKGEDGRQVPSKGNYDRTAGQLIDALRTCKDDIGAVLGDSDPDVGAWIRFNPLDGKGVKNENVTAFRYALVESDEMNLEEQHAMIRELELPVAALVSSGGKSLHAIVRIEAGSFEEYRSRVDYLYAVCEKNGLKVDRQNRNPSRLSRLPGVMRRGKKQFLLSSNIGKASWSEWRDWMDSVTEPKPFALLFEFAGDQKAVRHVLYNCAATRPSLTGATTTNTKEPSTETITITASPLSSGVIKAKTTPDTPDEKYNAWYQSVWQQGAAAGGGGG